VRAVTSFVGNHGVVAVFVLMFVAAVFPAASELTMIYAGALASGAVAGHIALGSHVFGSGVHAYLAVVITGIVGNLLGAVLGWAIGWFGGHPLLERHGKWLHVTPDRVERAERWFDRFGVVAVPLGFACPIVRSFVAIPAGIAEMRLVRMLVLAAPGVAAFSFGVAGLGWAVGSSWHTARHYFSYVDYVVVAAIVVGAAWLLLRRRRSSTMPVRGDEAR
jgi:membrane protein DedA with SNARE-associated domain